MTKFKNYRAKEYKKGIYLLNKNEGMTLEEFAKFGNMNELWETKYLLENEEYTTIEKAKKFQDKKPYKVISLKYGRDDYKIIKYLIKKGCAVLI